ncbi:MAG: PelD GGDEF domain-containing protein [Comamonadaceae bacterium]|nr:PelD GGDEF domain-containing protein [Comamonadaceae bacterium]
MTTPRPSALQLPQHLLGKLVARPAHPLAVLAEALALPLLALVLGQWWAPADPLQTQGAFAWPWLAPVVAALHYGPMAGLASASVLLCGWLLLHLGHWDVFPQMYFLGGLILTMLVGEFSSLWQARARRAETLQQYLEQRLGQLVRQHYLLRLSHDKLEQELIGRPMSMRDALAALRDVGREPSALAQAPDTLLRLLAQFCQLEAVALYPIVQDALQAQPQAQLGSCSPLQADDPMVQQALQTYQLCHISQMLRAQQHSRYLVAAPLLDLAGEPYGLLLVEDMPFFALQEENLQTLNLLLGYYTDGLSLQALAAPIVQAHPDCPAPFAFELQRLAHIHASTGVPSIIVALQFQARALAQELPQQILRLKRELDETWLLAGPQQALLAVLMPLGEASTAEGYIARLEGWIRNKGGSTLDAAGVFVHVLPLQGAAPLATIAQLQALAHA